jgi:hypothetical protein
MVAALLTFHPVLKAWMSRRASFESPTLSF